MKKTLSALLFAFAALLAGAPAFAQEDPCKTCLDQAGEQGAKCQAAAKSPADLLQCDRGFSAAHRACAAAACKGKPQAKGPCDDCKAFVRGETERCTKEAKAPDKAGCRTRSAEMMKSCEQRFCEAEPAKKTADPAKKPAAPAKAP